VRGPEIDRRWESRFPVPVQFGLDDPPASNVYLAFLLLKRPGLGVDHLQFLAPRLRIVGATPPPHPSVPAHTCNWGDLYLTYYKMWIALLIKFYLYQRMHLFLSYTKIT